VHSSTYEIAMVRSNSNEELKKFASHYFTSFRRSPKVDRSIWDQPPAGRQIVAPRFSLIPLGIVRYLKQRQKEKSMKWTARRTQSRQFMNSPPE